MAKWLLMLATLLVVAAHSQVSTLPRMKTRFYVYPPTDKMYDPIRSTGLLIKVVADTSDYGFPFKDTASIAILDGDTLKLKHESLYECINPKSCVSGKIVWYWGGFYDLTNLPPGVKLLKAITWDTSGYADTIFTGIKTNGIPTYTLTLTDTMVPLDRDKDSIHFAVECHDPDPGLCNVAFGIGDAWPPNKDVSKLDTVFALKNNPPMVSFFVFDGPGWNTPKRTITWPLKEKRPAFYRPYLRDTTAITAIAPPGSLFLQTANPWTAYAKQVNGAYFIFLERDGAVDSVYKGQATDSRVLFLTSAGDLAYKAGGKIYLKPHGQEAKMISEQGDAAFLKDGKWFVNHGGFSYVVDFALTPQDPVSVRRNRKVRAHRPAFREFDALGKPAR